MPSDRQLNSPQYAWTVNNKGDKEKEKLSSYLEKLAVFSLTFSSAGKGPFMASKAKNMRPCREGGGEWGSGVRDIACKFRS